MTHIVCKNKVHSRGENWFKKNRQIKSFQSQIFYGNRRDWFKFKGRQLCVLMFCDHLKSWPVWPARIMMNKHTQTHFGRMSVFQEVAGHATSKTPLSFPAEWRPLMFSCCICFCLTAEHIFHSGLFDAQRTVPVSRYTASLSQPNTHKKIKKTSAAWPVWRTSEVGWRIPAGSNATRLLLMLSVHTAMTAKVKWRAVSHGVSGHMDPFMAGWCTAQIGEPELITYLSERCELTCEMAALWRRQKRK